jgi:hypothetical protein
MTDEQKALAWLNRAMLYEELGMFGMPVSNPHRATIKAMLASPRLPAEPDSDMSIAMAKALNTPGDSWHKARCAYRALRAHLAGDKPAPVTITPHQGEQIIAALGEMRDLLSRCLDDIGGRK